MRISDWSSDVCSSDLSAYVTYSENAKIDALNVSEKTIKQHGLTSKEVACAMAEGALKTADINLAIATTDRKSVVKGKSVSVRVDLGGRCILKKKKKKNTNPNQLKL